MSDVRHSLVLAVLASLLTGIVGRPTPRVESFLALAFEFRMAKFRYYQQHL